VLNHLTWLSTWILKSFIHYNFILNGKGYSTGVGNKGGFTPDLKSKDEAVEVILVAIGKTGFKAGDEVSMCLDPAASELSEEGKYKLFKSPGKLLPMMKW